MTDAGDGCRGRGGEADDAFGENGAAAELPVDGDGRPMVVPRHEALFAVDAGDGVIFGKFTAEPLKGDFRRNETADVAGEPIGAVVRIFVKLESVHTIESITIANRINPAKMISSLS